MCFLLSLWYHDVFSEQWFRWTQGLIKKRQKMSKSGGRIDNFVDSSPNISQSGFVHLHGIPGYSCTPSIASPGKSAVALQAMAGQARQREVSKFAHRVKVDEKKDLQPFCIQQYKSF